MPRIDFYLLEQHTPAAHLRTTCRIADKAYRQQHQLLIYCQDKKQAQELDTLLWTFHDTSFIPHVLWQNQPSTEAPIIICEQSQSLPPQNRDILINLASEAPDFFSQFQRVIEIVSAEAQARELARERYRNYRNQGFEIHSHQIK